MEQYFTARIWKEEEWFIAPCAHVGVTSHGRTEEEAIGNLREMLQLHLKPPTAKIVPQVTDIEVEVGRFRRN